MAASSTSLSTRTTSHSHGRSYLHHLEVSLFSLSSQSSKYFRSNTLRVSLYVLQFAQIIGFVLNIKVVPWLDAFYFPDIRPWFHALMVPFWSASSFNMSFAIFIYTSASIIALFLMIFMIQIGTTSRGLVTEFRFLKLYKFVNLLIQAFTLPLSASLFSLITCVSNPSSVPFTALSSSGGCWTTVNSAIRLGSFIFLLVLLGLNFISHLSSADTGPCSSSFFSTPQTHFSPFWLVSAQLVPLYVYFILPHRPLVFLFSFIITPLILYILFNRFLPFYRLNGLLVYSSGLITWISVGISFAFYSLFKYLNSPWINGLIVFLLFIIPIILLNAINFFIVSYRYKKFASLVPHLYRSISLNEEIRDDSSASSDGNQQHVVVNASKIENSEQKFESLLPRKLIPTDVELYCRFLFPKPKKSIHRPLAKRIYDHYESVFQESVKLLLQRASFELFCAEDALAATVSLNKLKLYDFEPSFSTRYQIYNFLQCVDVLRRTLNTGVSNAGSLAQMTVAIQDAEDAVSDCTRSIFKFWTVLMNPKMSIDILPLLTEELKVNRNSAESKYQKLLASYPDQPEVYRSYSNFARDVLSDEDLFVSLVEQAELLGNTGHDSSSSGSKSAGGSLSFRSGHDRRTKKRGSKRKSRLLQSELLHLTKGTDKRSSIDGLSRGIVVALIVIFVCAVICLLSVEFSLRSVGNRLLVLVESSHMSYQSALLPLSLRQYAASLGEKLSLSAAEISFRTLQTSQHLLYHFNRIGIGKTYNGNIYECPRVRGRDISAINDPSVQRSIRESSIFTRIYRNSNPPRFDFQTTNLWNVVINLASSAAETVIKFPPTTPPSEVYKLEITETFRSVLDNQAVVFTTMEQFWTELLKSSDNFFDNMLILVYISLIVNLVVCAYVFIVFITQSLQRISQEKVGVLNLFLHLEPSVIRTILTDSKFLMFSEFSQRDRRRTDQIPDFSDTDTGDELEHKVLPSTVPAPNSVDFTVEDIIQPKPELEVSDTERLKLARKKFVVCCILYAFVLFIFGIVAIVFYLNEGDELIDDSFRLESVDVMLENMFAELLSYVTKSLTYALSKDLLFYTQYRADRISNRRYVSLNRLRLLLEPSLMREFEAMEYYRSKLGFLEQLSAFLVTRGTGQFSSLAPELENFTYNFYDEPDADALLLKYPELVNNWYTTPEQDNLDPQDQINLGRKVLTNRYIYDLTSDMRNVMNATATQATEATITNLVQGTVDIMYHSYLLSFAAFLCVCVCLALLYYISSIVMKWFRPIVFITLSVVIFIAFSSGVRYYQWGQEMPTIAKNIEVETQMISASNEVFRLYYIAKIFQTRFLMHQDPVQYISHVVVTQTMFNQVASLLDLMKETGMSHSQIDYTANVFSPTAEIFNLQAVAALLSGSGHPILNSFSQVFAQATWQTTAPFLQSGLLDKTSDLEDDYATRYQKAQTFVGTRYFNLLYDSYYNEHIRPVKSMIHSHIVRGMRDIGIQFSTETRNSFMVLAAFSCTGLIVLLFLHSSLTRRLQACRMNHVKQMVKIHLVKQLLIRAFFAMTIIAVLLTLLSLVSINKISLVQPLPHSLRLAANRLALCSELAYYCSEAVENSNSRDALVDIVLSTARLVRDSHNALLFEPLVPGLQPTVGRADLQDELLFAADLVTSNGSLGLHVLLDSYLTAAEQFALMVGTAEFNFENPLLSYIYTTLPQVSHYLLDSIDYYEYEINEEVKTSYWTVRLIFLLFGLAIIASYVFVFRRMLKDLRDEEESTTMLLDMFPDGALDGVSGVQQFLATIDW
ncbi:hypothetical protein RCL1_004259 [Eukaryota sp. TZLM3-RCL]